VKRLHKVSGQNPLPHFSKTMNSATMEQKHVKNIKDLLKAPSPKSKVFNATIGKSLEGLQSFYLTMAAWENGVLDYTVTPKTYQDIAQQFGYHEIMTKMFCEALTGIGLLTKQDDKYQNSPLATVYLTRSSTWCMLNTLNDMKTDAQLWSQLPVLLKNGPISKANKNTFSDGRILRIAEHSEAGSVSNVTKIVTKSLDTKRWRRLLDVGGGHGLYSIAFAALNPELDVYVFDQPSVTPITHQYINAYAAKRVNVISGDYTVDSIGQGYDAIFSSFNATSSDPKFIPKLVEALNPNGDLILRRHKDGLRVNSLQTLDWNLVHYEGTKLGRHPHSSDKMVPKNDYISRLKDAGLKVLDNKAVDNMSDIIFARKSPLKE
jgi:precorrin-6B methylase 2